MTIDLATPVGGIVRTIEAGEGATVEAEAPVIRLDDSAAFVAVRAAQLAAEDKSEEQGAWHATLLLRGHVGKNFRKDPKGKGLEIRNDRS
jgi:multidrug efflux pump subunit AcrA (membrane-fusion protein)